MLIEWLLLFVLTALACCGVVAVVFSRRRFDPRLARCVEPTATGYRVRLNGWDQSAYLLLVGGAFLLLAMLLRLAGAALPESSWRIAAALIAIAVTVWSARAEPFTQFLHDDETNGLLFWPGGSVRRDAVTGVQVSENVVRINSPEPLVVARFRTPVDADALAEWLRERLNVSDPRACALGYGQSSLQDSKSAPGGATDGSPGRQPWA